MIAFWLRFVRQDCLKTEKTWRGGAEDEEEGEEGEEGKGRIGK